MKKVILIILSIIVILFILFAATFDDDKNCLDKGGKFNKNNFECDLSQVKN